MTKRRMAGGNSDGAKTLVIALGNDILGDDGVGFHAARLLRKEFGDAADFVETGESGLALLDHLEGYDRALFLDAVATGKCKPGTILVWDKADFKKAVAPSPHLMGLPGILELAERVDLRIPNEIRVVAMEVHDPTVFREQLSPEATQALPSFVAEARKVLEGAWGVVHA